MSLQKKLGYLIVFEETLPQYDSTISDGLVQEVNDKNRIKVNVNIFGRPTPIELSMNQILIES